MAGMSDSGWVSLADRIAAAKLAAFVGRAAELDLFTTALERNPSPFAVLAIWGPGGTGKSTLLAAFAEQARRCGWQTILLDARNLTLTPAGFMEAFETARHAEAREAAGRLVVFLDTCEVLGPLEGWIRDSFLPTLPADSLLVMAGRNPLEPTWLVSSGLSALVQTLPLRNLEPDESRDFLTRRRIPPTEIDAITEFTHGHPLALSLVADAWVNRRGTVDPRNDPNLLENLLEHLLANEPDRQRRQALEVAAHARVTTESLLASIFGQESAHELFQWLLRCSFMEPSPEGVVPHDLIREVVESDLRWRHPERFEEIHRSVHRHAVSRIRQTTGQEQQRALHNLMYLHRHNPLWKPYISYDAYGQVIIEPAHPTDHDIILAIIQDQEGAESATIARYWMQRQPGCFRVVRGFGGDITQLAALIVLDEVTAADRDADPAVRLGSAHIESTRRESGHRAQTSQRTTIVRFAMGREIYRDSRIPLLISLLGSGAVYTDPHLDWTMMVVSDLEFWEPFFAYVNHHRLPNTDFTVDRRQFAVLGHDWRAEPIDAFDEILTRREISLDPYLDRMPGTGTALMALSRPEFDRAVREVLKAYHMPSRLSGNPLLRSRLVSAPTGGSDVQRVLAAAREAAESLRANPRTERFYRVLHRTYFEPALTQEQAAEELDLPFSTYRRYLTTGIDLLSDALWFRELQTDLSPVP